ncbi:MAG: protein translocase subunit SecD [Gemmatimonadales bacterium]|nr:protein translocase subunit SecD [Gemmatimonadales bacterium]MDZ4390074.1 protein translocase subunit SecD [Gemmatimonadales bacterium]
MFASLQNRVILILALSGLSIFYLFPRNVTERQRGPDGVMQDVTVSRVPLKRGLDLQGGMHLGLELDQSVRVSSDPARDIDLALTVLRKRIDEFGVTEPVIQRVGDERIVVELAGITDPDRAKAIVAEAAFLEFMITDKTRALENALPAMDRVLAQLGVRPTAPGQGAGPAQADQVTALLGGGDTAKAAAPLTDSTAAPDSAIVAPAGPILQELIIPSADLEGEYLVAAGAYQRVDSLLRLPEVRRLWPRGMTIKWSRTVESIGADQYRLLYVVDETPIITGERLVSANAQLDPLTNRPIVIFNLDRAGARRFGTETGRHVGDYMAIVLDGYVQGRPPVINSRIDRTGQIELGGRSIQDAQDLALTLSAGALPVPLKIVEERQVLASLGADSIRGARLAGLVGTLAVIIIMIGYYRVAGMLAVLALAFYLLFTLGGLAAIQATLTLPGLAGLVLSIGMAVDANVLIFERIREELNAGRTVRVAVAQGFQHAMSAIVDSNVSTVLTALFLFQFGTGPVRGFAVTLIMGIIASMFTAIFVTRTFFQIWLERKNSQATTLSI